MLLHDVNPLVGLCNRTKLIIIQLTERFIEAQIITGSNIKNRVFIPKIVFPINIVGVRSQSNEYSFLLNHVIILQLIRDRDTCQILLEFYFKEQVFTHDQLYVIVSRGTLNK